MGSGMMKYLVVNQDQVRLEGIVCYHNLPREPLLPWLSPPAFLSSQRCVDLENNKAICEEAVDPKNYLIKNFRIGLSNQQGSVRSHIGTTF